MVKVAMIFVITLQILSFGSERKTIELKPIKRAVVHSEFDITFDGRIVEKQ